MTYLYILNIPIIVNIVTFNAALLWQAPHHQIVRNTFTIRYLVNIKYELKQESFYSIFNSTNVFVSYVFISYLNGADIYQWLMMRIQILQDVLSIKHWDWLG